MNTRHWGLLFVAGMAVVGCASGVVIEGFGGDGAGGAGAGGGGAGPPAACSSSTECAFLSDGCNAGVCQAATCVKLPSNELATCDDGDPCTSGSICQGGTCTGASTVDCSMLDDDCHAGSCDPQLGCVAVPANDGAACDDGLYCSEGETCQAGSCTGGGAWCPAPSDVCLVANCHEAQQSCGTAPGPDGTACDDGNACTGSDACAAGSCSGAPVTTCANGDGCCPSGCTSSNDDDCSCDVNLALGATPTISSGGNVAPYTPAEMNNGIGQNVCQWAWVDDNTAPNGAWIQLTWAAPVTIGSMYIETENGLNPGPPCSAPTGRNIRSGTVQWWDGAQWITSTSFADQVDDVQLDLPAPVTTTRIRVYDLTTHPGNGNSIIYEWHVYGGPGCVPPP